MHKRNWKYGFAGLVLAVVGACSSGTPEQEPVAKVGDRYLYQSDISQILLPNTNREDSIRMANDYIQKWVKQELMLQKADDNLSPTQKNVQKELTAYRNSLIIYKYKNELIKQRMDTVVTRQQILDYYNAHPTDFNLDRNIVKAVFAKIPLELSNPDMMKRMVSEFSEDELSEWREYCLQYAKKYEIAIENWMDFTVLTRNFPITIDNPEKFLRKTDWKEMQDSNYYYIVGLHDFKLVNDLAPIEFVEKNIRNLILNQRKISFLKELEENIYTEGVRQKKFEIYNEETDELK